ncbi:uncharacterized protein HaLaN_12021, partial [Haematococcus lacustris]
MYSQQAVDEQAARNMLGAVFKRIAEQPPDRQQALIDLYFFSVANPDTDVAAMLASASSTFRSFILRGLQKQAPALHTCIVRGPVQGGAASPASPGMGKAGRVASVVGAEKMAEMSCVELVVLLLRDRFNRMTNDMASMPSRQSTSVAGSLNNSNLVSPASSLA